MKLEELQAEVNKLNSLLADPQPGMFTWHGMVNDVLTRIFKGFYATAPKLGGKLSQEQVIALFMADFMTWTSDRERNGTSWMLSLEEWAQRKYNLAYEAEKASNGCIHPGPDTSGRCVNCGAAMARILPAAPGAGGVGA